MYTYHLEDISAATCLLMSRPVGALTVNRAVEYLAAFGARLGGIISTRVANLLWCSFGTTRGGGGKIGGHIYRGNRNDI